MMPSLSTHGDGSASSGNPLHGACSLSSFPKDQVPVDYATDHVHDVPAS